jgi:hypothetical protein
MAVPLAAARDRVQQAIGIPVVLDPPALEEEGITPETPVSAKIKNVRAEDALHRLLEPLNLSYLDRNGVLQVTTLTKAAERNVLRVYPVADLLVTDFIPGEIDAQPLIGLIQGAVEPNSWSTVGGAGGVEFFPGTLSLVCSQTEPIQRQVARTLALLREARHPGQPVPKVAPLEFHGSPTNEPIGVPPEQADILDRLRTRRLSVDFQETPLGKVIELLSERTGLSIGLDRAALEEEGLTLETPVNFTLSDARAVDLLELLLSQLNLDWVVRHGELLITTAIKVSESLDTRVYPVADLVVVALGEKRWSVHHELLIELIQALAEPNSWDQVGGVGSIVFFPGSQCLVVNQTRHVHQEVTGLLTALRESAKRLPAIATAAGISMDRLQQHWTNQVRRTERANKGAKRRSPTAAGVGHF